MSKLHVTLFGRFCVRFAGQELVDIAVQKVQELFCYLLLHRRQPHHREKLSAVLWGDYSTTQAKTYLRKALWQMRQALSDISLEVNCPILLTDTEWLQLNPDLPLYLDTAVFEQVYRKVRGKMPPDINLTHQQDMEYAIRLYQGDLLEGWYQDWCIYERERFEFNYLSMLDKLLQLCEYQQLYEVGVRYGQRILHHDEAREHTHVSLMRLYYLAGNRTQALRQYQCCAEILLQELGVEPSQRTQELYEAIKHDNLLEIITFYDQGTYQPPSLQQTLNHLQNLQGILGHMQAKIEHEIAEVKDIL
ncbi:MAG: BTAD domain-containing putative transcriptional regulator [Candidatus Promineifilaceae bacterium]|nr:BTAD domain-containing putative transcriptional regulator [Candidatus Promineifilaceae bacterium]